MEDEGDDLFEEASGEASTQQQQQQPPLAPMGGAGVGNQPVTLDALAALLDEKLMPVSAAVDRVQSDIAGFQKAVREEISTFQADVKAEVTTLRTEVQSEVQGLSVRLASVETAIHTGAAPELATTSLAEMQKQIDALKYQRASVDYSRTLVLGRLAGHDGFDGAAKWAKAKLAELQNPLPIDEYCKGDFKDIVFLKFSSEVDRDRAVEALRKAKLTYGGKPVWARPDQPAEVRIPEKFLFGLKKQLVEWGFSRSEVRVDSNTGKLTVGGEEAVTAKAATGAISYQWHGAWKDWADLHNSPELKGLAEKANTSIKGSGGGAKGKGKASGLPRQ